MCNFCFVTLKCDQLALSLHDKCDD
uniref:Uncharacterized protein n=1 Tax=Arundo donax TaxID=35708 RepID=A0A0A9AG63_ARUDO